MTSYSILATSFLLGAAHAIEPGHGKSAMVGALLGSKRPWRDAIAMGLGTASGHALGVFVFAHLSFFFAHELLTGEIREFVEIGIGSLLVAIGGIWSFRLSRGHRHVEGHSCCSHEGSARSKHLLPGVGFLIGLIPCPTVIALAVSSVSFTEPMEVLSLSIVFGLGVALTLASIGLLITQFSVKLSAMPSVQTLSKYGVYVAPVSFLLVGGLLLAHALAPHH